MEPQTIYGYLEYGRGTRLVTVQVIFRHVKQQLVQERAHMIEFRVWKFGFSDCRLFASPSPPHNICLAVTPCLPRITLASISPIEDGELTLKKHSKAESAFGIASSENIEEITKTTKVCDEKTIPSKPGCKFTEKPASALVTSHREITRFGSQACDQHQVKPLDFFVNLNPHNPGQSRAPNNFVSSKFIVRIEPYPRAASGHTPHSKPLPSATLSARRAISAFWKSSAFSRINTAREVTTSMLNKYSQMPGSRTRYLEAVEQSVLHFALERRSAEAYKQQKNAGRGILLGASSQDVLGPGAVLAPNLHNFDEINGSLSVYRKMTGARCNRIEPRHSGPRCPAGAAPAVPEAVAQGLRGLVATLGHQVDQTDAPHGLAMRGSNSPPFVSSLALNLRVNATRRSCQLSHTVEITHGTQKHTQTTWFVPELRHQRYYCRALRWKSNWSPAIEMSSMLRSRCSSLERWGKSSPKCWWPLLACRDKLTQLPRCCPGTRMDLSPENLEAIGGASTPAVKKLFASCVQTPFQTYGRGQETSSPPLKPHTLPD
ncbi:hypothetical protein Anapl_08134 [Anas platyrhynchos]|uniref:Uncharacterized protein n=1 Tax=Anas platyrhynchos TaxID=8839 RepID=R0LMM4_ANAPL|nr:hypothetical protein Anapl_08134 [Anas platyrhynchos]